jgi:hypothetical protein
MKKRRRQLAKRRAPTRRWHIPPPLIHGPEALEGGGILHEWDGEVAVVLWQGARDVLLWATCEPKMRGEIFARRPQRGSRATAVLHGQGAAQLGSSVGILEQLVAEPASARAEQVARACRQI